jgi:hypothetical protein
MRSPESPETSAKSRRYPRFDAEAPVRLGKSGSDRACEGKCVKVAVGGIGVHAPADFAIGDEVEVEFVSAPSAPHRARIVYRNGTEYGLEFVEIV